MSTDNRLRSWDVEYLLPYPALPSAKPDVRARGHYLHREVVMASSAGEVVRELSSRGAVPVDVTAAREPHPMFQRVTAAYQEQFLLGLQFGVLHQLRLHEGCVVRQRGAVHDEGQELEEAFALAHDAAPSRASSNCRHFLILVRAWKRRVFTVFSGTACSSLISASAMPS